MCLVTYIMYAVLMHFGDLMAISVSQEPTRDHKDVDVKHFLDFAQLKQWMEKMVIQVLLLVKLTTDYYLFTLEYWLKCVVN